MTKAVGVRFKPVGKIYDFDPGELELKQREQVIVETVRGIECGVVVQPVREISDEELVTPLKKVIRVATTEDLAIIKKNKDREKEAYDICKKKIAERQMDMNLVDVECTFDGNKILFYFTADSRLDFRDLVKDLAGEFRTRIELRQIGVRDEAKMVGGIGICGRGLCCNTYLEEFEPVSIKMAKEQGLSLNPTKISGSCGRLMCCLKFEQDAYEDLLRVVPKIGAHVMTPMGKGVVEKTNLLRRIVTVRHESAEQNVLQEFDASEVQVIGRNHRAPEKETEKTE